MSITEPDTDNEELPPPDTSSSLEFECKKFVLQTLIDKASSVLPSRDLMPVLKNFQFEVSDLELRVIATDLELSVVSQTQMVSIKKPGSAVFPGRNLLDIVKSAEDGDLILKVEDGKCHIQVGRTEWNLLLMDGTDYPPLPDLDEVELFPVDRAEFLDGISAVRYAAAIDTVRPQLMMIDVQEGKMRASDGTRFQQVSVNVPIDVSIPIGAIEDLVRLLKTTEQEKILIGEDDNHLIFRFGSDTFIASKLTVEFPDIESRLLKPAAANNQELHIDREELSAAIKRIRVTADEETSAILLELEKDKCRVSSRDKYGQNASELLDVSWDHGERTIAVNHAYLTDMLNMLDAKSCNFWLGEDTKTRRSPLMLRDDETGLIGIISQIRIEMLVSGASSGDSDFRKRGDGDYDSMKGKADPREDAALQMLNDDSE